MRAVGDGSDGGLTLARAGGTQLDVLGWLAGWLAGWLVGWLAGWLVGWLAGWMTR